MPSDTDMLKDIYRIFSPAPLAADQRDLYVDLEAVRGDTRFVESLATPIRLEDKPTCQLLTGHTGSGKSTELRRLQHRLMESQEAPFVVICDISEDLNPSDLDYPELLIMMLRGLAVELEKLGITLQPGLFQQRWEWIKRNLLTEIEFDEFTLSLGMMELAGVLKHSPQMKKKLREHIDPETDSWIAAANDIIGEAKLKLREKGYNDLVILVDGLDKMSRDDHPKAKCSVGEHLYINRSRDLSSLECHVVYTIPLYLAYSSSAHQITSRYGLTDIPVVPVTKLRSRPPAATRHEPGFEQFREIIRRRLTEVGVTENSVFEEGARDRLIELSGGQLRELMVMTRDAAATSLPIDNAAIERIAGNVRRVYARWLETKHWPIIKEVLDTGQITAKEDNAAQIEQLLDSRAILHYRNKREWYGANPLLPDPPPSFST